MHGTDSAGLVVSLAVHLVHRTMKQDAQGVRYGHHMHPIAAAA